MTNKNDDPSTKAAKLLRKAAEKEQRKRSGEKSAPRGKPFGEGFDERRNVSGSKPRNMSLLRETILDIMGEEIDVSDPITGVKTKVSKIYWMLNKMALGKNAADHADVLAYGFGKVPDETRNLSAIDDFIFKNMDLFTDGQIQRIQKGEDKTEILAELLRSAQKIVKEKQNADNKEDKKKK